MEHTITERIIKEGEYIKNGLLPIPAHMEDFIIPMQKMFPKLVLGGSLILHMLGVGLHPTRVEKSDLDFSLTEPLTEEELAHLINFFDFKKSEAGSSFDGVLSLKNKKVGLKVDIFLNDFLKPKNLFIIFYGTDYEIKCVYPPEIIKHKSRMAWDPRVFSNTKHTHDLENINKKLYNKIVIKNFVDVKTECDLYIELFFDEEERKYQQTFKNLISPLPDIFGVDFIYVNKFKRDQTF